MVKSTRTLSIFFLFTFVFLLFSLQVAKAGLLDPADPNKVKPDLQVKIGQTLLTFDTVSCEGGTCEIGWIGEYVAVVYRYGVGLAAVLATVMIMVGGFIYLTAGGSPTQVSKAKDFIISSLTGLLLALFSFMILYTINPRLTALDPIGIRAPAERRVQRVEPATSGLRAGAVGEDDRAYWTPGDFFEYTRRNEGVSLTPYTDIFGNPTIGYGHLITGNEDPPIGSSITDDRANELFIQDYQTAVNAATGFVGEGTWNTLAPDRRTVLADMAFNLGEGGLNEFNRLRTAARNENWIAAGAEILDSDYARQLPNRAGRNANIMVAGDINILLGR